jgi:DNA sulfur modification protein DndB
MTDELLPATKPSPESLGTLLSEDGEKRAAWIQRKSLFRLKTVHPAEVDAEKSAGWEVQRVGKRKAQLRRPKTHDKLLEDRVWAFLYLMGYSKLNADKFRVSYQRDDGSTGSKQIDVFACDAETAFVIECKSKDERGRRSLQKDLHESIALQNFIRQSIYGMYAGELKPKVIWVYATHNIIWSDPDVERAASGNIHIITENVKFSILRLF